MSGNQRPASVWIFNSLFGSMRPFSAVLVWGAAVISSAIACAGEPLAWNQWRGPQRDGQVGDSDWPSALGDHLSLVWQQAHAPSYSGPITFGDWVFTTETINKQVERVTAYELATGNKVWHTEWPGEMTVPFFAASNGSWIRATPACVDGHLLVMGMRDVLVCLDPATGNEKWRVDFPHDMGGPVPSFGAASSPIIDGDGVIVQTGGAVMRLSLADGSLIWKTLENAGDMMSSGAFSSPTIAMLCAKRQLVVQTRTHLCGVELSTGKVLWREPIEAFRGMNILTPLVVGNQVYTSAHSGKAQLFDIRCDESGRWSVHEVWNQKTQAYMSSPVLVGDTIYLHAKNQRVVATALQDGTIRWTSSPQAKYWSMVSNGERILALAESGDLLLLDASDEQFNVIDKTKVAEDAWAHLAVQGPWVIVRDLAALRVYRWTESSAKPGS
tara:strand:+ start:49951 stop:51273 length:1323 start_codon:yes stop_codon:yes gene_type:complete